MRASLSRCVLPLTIPLLIASIAVAAPKKDVDALIADLNGANFEKRVDAIEQLGASGDPRAVDAILPKLRDADATVRWAAAGALEVLKDPKAIPALEEAAKDPSPLVAERARAALRILRPGTKRDGVFVKISTKDNTKLNIPGLDQKLAEGRKGLETKKVNVGDADPSHNVTFVAQTVKEKVVGSETQLEVYCTATVTELPGNQLRFATRVGVGVNGSNPLSDKERAQLVGEAVESAAQALGEEAAGWLTQAK